MVAAQLQAVQARIAEAARRVGRPPESVRLVCVTISATLAQVEEALAAGATDFGENRVQEARPKIQAIGPRARWHLIGHLQRNKAKVAAELFDWIQTVDGVELAQALDRQAAARGRCIPVLIEVNTSGEPTKSGVRPDDLDRLLEAVAPLAALEVRGLMTMAPIVQQPSAARPYFERLRGLAERHRLTELSMGMSQDFEVAVEEGATLVRVGSAIFS